MMALNHVQHTVHHLEKWESILSLNVKKTKYVLFLVPESAIDETNFGLI